MTEPTQELMEIIQDASQHMTRADLIGEVTRLRSRVDELERALKPFADLGDYILAEAPIDATRFEVWTRGDGDIKQVSLEYFRRARAAIRALSSGGSRE